MGEVKVTPPKAKRLRYIPAGTPRKPRARAGCAVVCTGTIDRPAAGKARRKRKREKKERREYCRGPNQNAGYAMQTMCPATTVAAKSAMFSQPVYGGLSAQLLGAVTLMSYRYQKTQTATR